MTLTPSEKAGTCDGISSTKLFLNIPKLHNGNKDSKDQESIQSSTTLRYQWENNKITIKIRNKSQDVSPFPSGDHKAEINRRENMTNTKHK